MVWLLNLRKIRQKELKLLKSQGIHTKNLRLKVLQGQITLQGKNLEQVRKELNVMCLKNIKSHQELKVQVVWPLNALVRQLRQKTHRFIQDQSQILIKVILRLQGTIQVKVHQIRTKTLGSHILSHHAQIRKVILSHPDHQVQGTAGRILHQAARQEVNHIHHLHDQVVVVPDHPLQEVVVVPLQVGRAEEDKEPLKNRIGNILINSIKSKITRL